MSSVNLDTFFVINILLWLISTVNLAFHHLISKVHTLQQVSECEVILFVEYSRQVLRHLDIVKFT